MKICTIRWDEALPIRHKVLWPNKPVSFCKVQGDEEARHYGVYIDEKLVCVASVFSDMNIARLRKFATLPSYQGRGIGSQLINFIFNELKKDGVEVFWCDARKTAAGFYQKFGMKQQGGEFIKSGVLYYKMEVKLI